MVHKATTLERDFEEWDSANNLPDAERKFDKWVRLFGRGNVVITKKIREDTQPSKYYIYAKKPKLALARG